MSEQEYRNGRGVSADVGRSKNQGTPYVRVAFEFLNDEGEPTGQGNSWDGYLTDKTYERTLESLKACGWDGKDWETFNGISNKVVRLTLKKETYKDKSFWKIEWVNRASMGRPIDESLRIVGKARRALAEQFSGGKKSEAPRARPAFDDFDPKDDDDIPF